MTPRTRSVSTQAVFREFRKAFRKLRAKQKRKGPHKHPVSTKPIVRELRRAVNKLNAMKRKKKVPATQRRVIDLEIKVLEYCEDPICDIWEC